MKYPNCTPSPYKGTVSLLFTNVFFVLIVVGSFPSTSAFNPVVKALSNQYQTTSPFISFQKKVHSPLLLREGSTSYVYQHMQRYDTVLESRPKKYQTQGEMFDIERGPDHHLIDNPSQPALNSPNVLIEDPDAKKINASKKVNVHEMEIDASTFTFLLFGVLALLLFTVPLRHN